MSALDTLSHWRLARDPDGLAWLTFDRAASAVNALGRHHGGTRPGAGRAGQDPPRAW